MADAQELIDRIERDLAALRELLPAPEPTPAPEEWLTPCELADGITDDWARKLIIQGLKAGVPGTKKIGGRYYATRAAFKRLRG